MVVAEQDTVLMLDQLEERIRDLEDAPKGGRCRRCGDGIMPGMERDHAGVHAVADTTRDLTAMFPESIPFTEIGQGHIHPPREAFDKVIKPGQDIAGAFNAGAKSVLALNGAHPLGGSFTVPADGYLVGQTRAGAIITLGSNKITARGTMENLTVDEGTSQPSVDIKGGTVRDVTATNCVRHMEMTADFGVIDNCLLEGYDGGNQASGDAPLVLSAGGVLTIVNTKINISAGDSATADRCCVYATTGGITIRFANCFFLQNGSGVAVSRPNFYATNFILSTIANCVFFGLTGVTDGGILRLGSSASNNAISGCAFYNVGFLSATSLYLIKLDSTDNTVSGCALLGGEDGIIVAASRNVISGNTIRGVGKSSGDGINLNGNFDNNVMMGNICTAWPGYGINIESEDADSNVVLGNILTGNTTGALFDAADDTTKKGFNVTA